MSCPLSDSFPVFQMQNPGTGIADALFMGDEENDFSLCGFLSQAFQNDIFGSGIQGAGGLIQNEHLFVGKESAGKGDALPLAA